MTIQPSFKMLVRAGVVALACMAQGSQSFALDVGPGLSFADIASRVRNSVVTVAAAVVDRRAVAESRRKGGGNQEGKAGAGDDSQSYDDFSPSRPKQKPGEPPRQFTSIGSGFIIDSSGIIVTNNHVIEGGNAFYVILADGTELKVDKVLGRDTKTDITLLKVTPKTSKPLSAVSFGDSARTRVGDWVLAIGNPFGLNGTVTAGILSGRGRDINAGPYDDFLQTDASINRGNSGGPLFNAAGEVIGINTAIFSPSGGSIGLGFAIPSNTARRIVDQLQRYGETRWGWIGLRLQTPSDDIAASLNLPGPGGAIVARVDKGGPAETAGLSEGDVILSFAGSEIKHARQLPRFVAQAAIGEEADVTVLRDGVRKIIKVKIGRLDEAVGSRTSIAPQGHARRPKIGKTSFEPLSDDLRQKFSIAGDAEGAVVTGGALQVAAGDSVQPGDLVIEAAHQRVRTLADLEARLLELQRMSRQDALLTVQGPDGSIRFASLALADD